MLFTLIGSDLLGQATAVLAAVSMVFAETDPAYSEMLLGHAKETWT